MTGSVEVRVRYDARIRGGLPASSSASTVLTVTDDVDRIREDEVTAVIPAGTGDLDLGRVVFRTLDCELWRIGNQVVRDYHRVRQAPPPAGQYHLMRRAAVDVGAPAWASYDHVPVRTDFLEGSSGFPTNRAGERERILFHEFGHTIAFVADGTRAYWDGNVFRWAYARNHDGTAITNVQYAFMEGWGRYWQNARTPGYNRAKRWTSHDIGFLHWNESLIVNRLLELAALVSKTRGISLDAADGEMVEILEVNPGAIHSLHELEVEVYEALGLTPPEEPPSCPPGWTDDGATCHIPVSIITKY